MKKFFTTSEAANICGVAHTTVIRWITEGKLKAHETPGGHRRIQHEELTAFMKQFDIPTPLSFGDGRYRILAVDDDKNVLTMIRRAFAERSGEIELETTDNGMEALVMLGKNRFDLILLDIVMPGMDGVQFCRTIKKNPNTSGIKIIAITGKQLTGQQEDYLAANAEYILRKPFLPSVLLEKAEALRQGEAI